MDIDIKVDEPYANAKYVRLQLTPMGLSSIDKDTKTPTTKDYITYMLEVGNGLQILKNEQPKLHHFGAALQKIIAENCIGKECTAPTAEEVTTELSLLMGKDHIDFIEV